jgi:hypothetical protein
MLFVSDFPNLSPYCGNLLIPIEYNASIRFAQDSTAGRNSLTA